MAEAMGERLLQSNQRPDGRNAGSHHQFTAAGSVIGHKMSMLQDLERGRSMEIDALVTVVQELGLLTGVATPTVDVVLALVKERANASGLYQPLRSQPASDGTD